MSVLGKKLKEIVAVAKGDLATFDLFRYMNEIAQLANLDEELRCEIETLDNTHAVFEATDTGRSVSISFAKGGVSVQMGKGEDFSLKFEATESTYLELLSGELDPDSAFFRRRIKIIGPLTDALRLKNILFAKIIGKES